MEIARLVDRGIIESHYTIYVWPFNKAPRELQNEYGRGGDEDWLALVPPTFANSYIPWLDSSEFGPCVVNKQVTEDGWQVWVGTHA